MQKSILNFPGRKIRIDCSTSQDVTVKLANIKNEIIQNIRRETKDIKKEGEAGKTTEGQLIHSKRDW